MKAKNGMLTPSLHSHYRNFNTTTNESDPYTSPTFPESLLPLSILQNDIEFTCSLKWPVLRSCQLNPGCGVAGIFRTSTTLVIGTHVITYFPHRDLLSRGFVTGLFTFSSTVLTCRDHSPRFSLPLTTHWFPRYATQGLTVSAAEL